MKYKIFLTRKAEEQLLIWKETGQKKELMKIFSLFRELEEHPKSGTGQIEKLRGNLAGYWSRRINKQHRIIYSVQDDIVTVNVISVRGHYGEK